MERVTVLAYGDRVMRVERYERMLLGIALLAQSIDEGRLLSALVAKHR